MQKLIRYHTVDADPRHYWTNAEVGKALNKCKLETYDDYLKECKLHGVSPYNEECFNEYLEQYFKKNEKIFKKV